MQLSKWCIGLSLVLMVVSGSGLAKLPPPSEEQKAKAEESKAKAAEAAKKDAEILGKAQDHVAEKYIQQMKAKGVEVRPTPITPPVAPASVAPSPAPAALGPAPVSAAAPVKK